MTILEAIVIGLGFAIGFYSFIIVLTMVLFLGFLIYGYVSAHREDKSQTNELAGFEAYKEDNLNVPAYIRRETSNERPF
jgi:hypothetical protein